jgi:class 3 adenylate cyclase
MGDGCLFTLAIRRAHEDDAERAGQAGLELIQAVTNLKSSDPLQTRVGIATGLVVVGDLIGSGSAQEPAIVGETPNSCQRIEAKMLTFPALDWRAHATKSAQLRLGGAATAIYAPANT